jgi:CheY-like chemotaxis protein/nitrogen-specific signal transduction histidine kinase
VDQVAARHVLERTGRERERLLAELETASRTKDEFLAMLGHELRNPLAPILTALELMRLKGGDVLIREREIIERQAAHLVHLVDDLLDVARVAQGKIELRRTRVAIAEVVSRAAETASPLLEQKAHTLRVDVAVEGLDVDGDPVRLSQVVANLLTNAAKYSDPGAHIQVTASRQDDEIAVRVVDDGAGIAPEQLPHLFEAFFQGPRARDRAEGGLGLGLALVKSLVALHGGTVSAASDGLGRGSVFEIRLPALDASSTTPERAPRQRSLPPSDHATRVLIVDDNVDIAELFTSFLETFGFDVRAAHDGPRALELVETFHPDVAVLDIGLPVMDGYELASRLRERFGEGAPTLIAMTGYGQTEDRETSRLAGFARHLVKPVDAYALVEAIGECRSQQRRGI